MTRCHIQLQRGSFLLEALIAIVLFSFGILGLVGLQAAAFTTNVDTGYRIEANNYANRMLSQIQVSLPRDTQVAYNTSLNSFQHHPDGDQCDFSGAVAAHPAVALWLEDMLTAASRLPDADGQIRVIPANPANPANPGPWQIRIVICWQQPGLPVPRRHVLAGSVT